MGAQLTTLSDTYANVEQDIEGLDPQRENTNHDMALVVALETVLERVRQVLVDEQALY